MSTEEDLESAHKKALKALEGEKRAAIKKAKGTKGKKAKEALATVESDFAEKLRVLKENHEKALKTLQGGEEGGDVKVDELADNLGATNIEAEDAPKELTERERKLAKAQRKRERQKEKEAERQRELEEEEANAGPSLRQTELDQIEKILKPLNLKIAEVEADGHCLYRSVAAQTGNTYSGIRGICADFLQANEDEFAPFCEYSDDVTSFSQYVEQVRSSSEWGGHLELRALALSLKRKIVVYSLQSGSSPLKIGDDTGDQDAQPILLSYHLHYYALGEHYNQVVSV